MLTESKLWWHGPHWITDGSQWPINMEEPETNLSELKTTTVILVASEASNILTRFSTYNKLIRAYCMIAYCMRWKRNLREAKLTGPLTVDELENAEEIIARMVQQETFLQEYSDLQKGRNLSRKSKLRPLDPFKDK